MKQLFLQFTHTLKTLLYAPRAVVILLSSPKLLSLCLLPIFVGLCTTALSLLGFFYYKAPIVELLGVTTDSWYFFALSWVVVLLGFFISALLGFIASTLLSSFLIEQLIEILFARKKFGRSARATNMTLLSGITRSFFSELIFLTAVGLCTLLAFFLSFVPPLAIAPLLVASMFAGMSLYFTPLGVMQYSLGERFAIIKKHWLTCFVLGACLTATLTIPFAAVILMPLFYVVVIESITSDKSLISSDTARNYSS